MTVAGRSMVMLKEEDTGPRLRLAFASSWQSLLLRYRHRHPGFHRLAFLVAQHERIARQLGAEIIVGFAGFEAVDGGLDFERERRRRVVAAVELRLPRLAVRGEHRQRTRAGLINQRRLFEI